MEITKRKLKWYAANNAVDITKVAVDSCAKLEPMEKIGYCVGVYGLSGLLLQGRESGNFYVITARTPALFYFG